ncbi:MAG: hypothetical protein ISR91_05045 [Candidatus Delongbacteria bacterium]|nr:hypothetical protein [Candidatus Delongbacteria bacterium]
MKFRLIRQGALPLLVGILLSGCLQVQETVYRFQLHEDGTMTGTIRFLGIVSSPEDGEDVSTSDFMSLVSDYLEGEVYENEHPFMEFSGKRFWVENNTLNGELSFTMREVNAGGFLIDPGCDCAAIYLVLSDDYSPLVVSNGELIAGEACLRWPAGTTEFSLTAGPDDETEAGSSLASFYERWQAGGEFPDKGN